jgi:hypothetical protein
MRMRTIILCFIAFATGMCGGGTGIGAAPLIKEVYLDPNKVHDVTCAAGMVTTFRFPQAVKSVKGMFFSENPEQIAGDWILHFDKGAPYVSVTPYGTNSPQRTMNIVTGDNVYVVSVRVADDADSAVAVVRFHTDKTRPATVVSSGPSDDAGAGASADTAAETGRAERGAAAEPAGFSGGTGFGGVSGVSASKNPPVAEKKADGVSAAQLVGFLDKVKLLNSKMPPQSRVALLKEMQGVRMVFKENAVSDFGAVRVVLKSVVRDSRMDALGFALTIENLSRYNLLVEPESLWFRCGAHVRRQTLSDVSPQLPALKSVDAYFVVVGDGQGGKNRLLPENEFKIGLRVGRVQGEPVDPPDAPRPAAPPTTKEAAPSAPAAGEGVKK